MPQAYVQKNGQILRCGFTTGTCAAAAAKAATKMLFSGKKINEIEVTLPVKEKITLQICDAEVTKKSAKCCIVKDAGDDPDVTNGAKICVSARKIKNGITIKGGEGVGKVTKLGLKVAVGEPAINPVPHKMILDEVSKVLPKNKGVEITISVPHGKELAKKTMNERLGILGGISILGTTGIVEPMSVEAFKESLLPQIDVAIAHGYDEVVLTPGRIGEKNAVGRGIPREAVILTSNFIGFMLKACASKGIKKALLFGSAGKLAKLARGIFYTHSKAESALKAMRNSDKNLDSIAEKAAEKATKYTGNKIKVAAVMLSLNGEIVCKSSNTGASKWARFLL